jgi:hypothetical protein
MSLSDAGEMRARLEEVDWQRPWLVPFCGRAVAILAAADWRLALNDAATAIGLRNHHGLPIHFVPQSNLPAGIPYESFISATGAVPTRTNLHDFFNALVWLTFPLIKVQLNHLQAAEIERAAQVPAHLGSNGSEHRGKLRDGATIFDENAALFITASPTLAAALHGHDWQHLFLQERISFQKNTEVCLFGHALMEKLVAPYKAITAHAWTIIVDQAFFSQSLEARLACIDAVVAEEIAGGLATSDFSHLPILGVPDWWKQQDVDFYADVSVFRPKRHSSVP